MTLLEKINSAQEFKKLKPAQLEKLAFELRERIIEAVSSSGGHLASSLGAVELIIALHYCLDLGRDKLIFDVGHQAYAHKLLTGRNKAFSTLRQYGGISGFPCKDESVHDIFTTGHSSNAVSLALGLVCAADLAEKEKAFKVVAVIGDGSLSGGLCFEGLNNAGHLKKDMLVVLNTNEMSISPNVGALSNYLNKIISLPIYNRFKVSLEDFVATRFPKGSRIIKLANKFEEGLKGLFVPGMFFEELGFRYFGPFDGHNLTLLVPALKKILEIKGPKIFHVVTKKGKGYPPAESEPVKFHSTGPFEISTGSLKAREALATYTQVFSKKITELARRNKNIIAITAAMPQGTGLDIFHKEFPERFFDVGIAEGHAVSFAAGLAKGGLRPVVAIYSTFLQRAFDQLIEDVALQDLPVVFVIDRAGIVGEDGVTHQGIFDVGYLRNIPNLVVMAPKDGSELEAMLEFAIDLHKPAAIRFPKAALPSLKLEQSPLELGKPQILKDGKRFAIIALGSMVVPAYEAMELLEQDGFRGSLVNARFVKPLDKGLFDKLACQCEHIFCLEEAMAECGFGSALSDVIGKPVIRLGLPSEFIVHGKREILLKKYGLDKFGIAAKVKAVIRNA